MSAAVVAQPTPTPCASHTVSSSNAAPVASINFKAIAESMEASSPALRRRKRSSSDQLTRDDVKKQRGRPRVEPKDETAADRRRTQIRLAQRTYRARKESTITNLEDKVNGLEEALNQSRSNLRTIQRLALQANLPTLNPTFFQELSRLVDIPAPTFEGAHDVRPGTDEEYVEDLSPEARSGSESDDGCHRHHPQTEVMHQPSDSSALVPVTSQQGLEPRLAPLTSAPDMRDMPTALGYDLVYEAPETSTTVNHNYGEPLYPQQHYVPPTYGPIGQHQYSMPPQQAQTPPYHQQPLQQSNMVQQPQNQSLAPFPIAYHRPSIPNELAMPRGQAFNEDSFSRYFQRACLEWATSLIVKPGQRPDVIQRIFGHPLQFSTLNQIKDRLHYRLSRSADEDLDSPLYRHNGDAEPVDSEGYLRPAGVEQYLSMKGLKGINPRAQTMVCQISGSNSPVQQLVQQQQASNSTPPQPDFQGQGVVYPSVQSTPGPVPVTPQAGHQQQHPRQYAQHPQQPLPQHPNQQPQQQYHEYPLWPPYVQMQNGRKCMQINVQRFLNALITSSTCRGKTPAVTTEAVDKAIRSSIIKVGPCSSAT